MPRLGIGNVLTIYSAEYPSDDEVMRTKSVKFDRHLAALSRCRRRPRGSTDPILGEHLGRQPQVYDRLVCRIDRKHLAAAEMVHENTDT
jgi:hypothetical protein